MGNGRDLYTGNMDQDEESADSARRKRLFLMGAIALAVLVLLGAYFAFSAMKGETDGGATGTAGAGQVESIPTVTVKIAQDQSIDSVIAANGSVAARREMPVGAVGEGGQIVRVLVEPGQWVKQGQTLAIIDRSVQARQAEALAASVRVAQADADLAQSELTRADALVARGFISKADIDRKTADRDSALARVRVAQAQYQEATARNARLNIVAPAAGLVLTRDVEPGQIVGSGSGVLFRIAKDGEMEMLAELAESDLQRIKLGAKAVVSPVGTALKINGQVWQLSPVVDPQTRQGIVRIAVPYNNLLRPGGFADARLVVGSGNAPLLPESAVMSSPEGNYVLIVDAQNSIRRRPITVGTVTDNGVAVASGLSGGEKVVILAGAFLSVGDKVIPQILKSAR